jgi:hypothetical protein
VAISHVQPERLAEFWPTKSSLARHDWLWPKQRPFQVKPQLPAFSGAHFQGNKMTHNNYPSLILRLGLALLFAVALIVFIGLMQTSKPKPFPSARLADGRILQP